MKDRILKLLVSGYKQSDICGIVGCTPSYISQLMADEDFKAKVIAGMTEAAQENDEEVHLENRYQKLKHKILNNIEESLPNAELPQLVRALEVVDKVEDNTKRRKMPVPSAGNVINGTVHITNIALPAHALAAPAPIVTLNEKSEIIAIDNKPLAPMSSTGVKNIFSQIQQKRVQDKVGKLLDDATAAQVQKVIAEL